MRSVDCRHALPRAGNPEKGFPMLTSSVVPDRTRIVAGEESLIADRRAGLTPSDMVEQKLRALLHGAPLRVGHLRLGLLQSGVPGPRGIEYVCHQH